MKVYTLKSDTTGMIASGLCMIHCVATPFIFLAKTCSDSCCSGSPTWWQWVDVFFLFISLLAVYHAARHTAKNWVKYAMWISWSLLFLVILTKQLQLFYLFENTIYIPALSLVGLHFYNLKFCKCADDSCPANQT